MSTITGATTPLGARQHALEGHLGESPVRKWFAGIPQRKQPRPPPSSVLSSSVAQIDIRVRPGLMFSIVIWSSLVGISVFGVPSSLVKPSRTVRQCGRSTSRTSQ